MFSCEGVPCTDFEPVMTIGLDAFGIWPAKKMLVGVDAACCGSAGVPAVCPDNADNGVATDVRRSDPLLECLRSTHGVINGGLSCSFTPLTALLLGVVTPISIEVTAVYSST